MIRRLLVAAALVLGVLALPSVAHAQYPTSCGFILDPPAIPVGGTVNIRGSLFGPNNTVTFFIVNPTTGARAVLGTTTSDSDPDGNLAASFSLPAGFNTDGEYLIEVECPDGQIASNVLIVGAGNLVTDRVTTASLPVTGQDSLGLVKLGVVLLGVGGLLLLAVRRRQRLHGTVGT